MPTKDTPPTHPTPQYLVELRDAATATGLSREEIARRSMIGKRKVTGIMSGAQRPTMDDLVDLAEVLGLAPLRVLALAGRLEGLTNLLTYVEQLEEQVNRIERAATVFMHTPTAVASMIDRATAAGEYIVSARPRRLGLGEHRVHYDDTIVLQPILPTGDSDAEQRRVEKLMGAEMAWFGAGLTPNPHMGAGLPGAEHQLVMGVPRFLAIRKSTGNPLPGAPRSVCVIGGHWAGAADVASFLGYAFDYDFCHVGSMAARVFARLTHEPAGPRRDAAQEEVMRTYIAGADLGRMRTWAADAGDSDRSARLLAAAHDTSLGVVYLRPSDELIEWSAVARHRLRHNEDGPTIDAARMRRARADVDTALRRIRQRTVVIDSALPADIDRNTTEYIDEGDIFFEGWRVLAERSLAAIHGLQGKVFAIDEARRRMNSVFRFPAVES